MAVANIPQHIKITEEMLKVKSVPEEAIHKDAAKTTADLVGFTTKVEILADEQILITKIAKSDEKTGLSYKIPENMRAIVVPTTEVSGLAGYLAKGDKIDLLATYTNRPITGAVTIAGEGERLETFTQLQNLEVLEIGIVETIDETGKVVKAQGVPTSVTLLVTPQQAEVISLMLSNGTFQMTLRNPVDGIKVPLDHYGSDNFDDWRNR